MSNLKTKFPLFLGLTVLVVSILTASIRLGEKTRISTGRISASQNQANLSLKFSSPDNISIIFSATTQVRGADIVLLFNREKIEILPSTLTGMSGYISTGGEVADNNKFLFSTVNTGSSVKSGILATFRFKGEASGFDFDNGKTKVYGDDLTILQTNFEGL